MSILTSFVLLMSSLILENASSYLSHNSSNFCLTSGVTSRSCSCTFLGPGTSAGEQIKAVSGRILGRVLCLWGTQLHGLDRCSLICSSEASSMLYFSMVGCSAKVMTVSLPICHASARPPAFLSTTKSLHPYIPSSCVRNAVNGAVRL